jgi:peptide/nickel transport system permease protein
VALLGERATPDQIATLRENWGLDQPLLWQYWVFLTRLFQLDLGASLVSGVPVMEEIQTRWPATLELALAAMVIALIVGIPAGVLAASYRNRWIDQVLTAGSLLGVSLPIYWLGLLLIYAFAVQLQWLPPSGRISLTAAATWQPITGLYLLDALLQGNLAIAQDVLRHLLLPACTLSTIPLAILARMTRTTLLETLNQGYIQTARAKGLPEGRVILQHALKNALLPILTVMGLQFGTLLTGAILTETIFTWPGIGLWIYDAILARDYPVVQGGIILVATSVVLVNSCIDLSYGFIDPRIQHS